VLRANVFGENFEWDDDDPDGYHGGVSRISKALGASGLVVKLFTLLPAQSICPYHYEYEEEWLVVLEGDVLVRTPAGEETLTRGDTVCFAPGPDGAHKVTNGADGGDARLLMFSSAREPSVAVYPDSDKVGVWTPDSRDHFMLRRSDGNVDYWEGERS
jgi:uncharacterized cupin superfamily protein